MGIDLNLAKLLVGAGLILLTSVGVLLGLLRKLRNKDTDGLTRAGCWAVGVAVFAVIFSVANFWFDHLKNSQDAAAASARDRAASEQAAAIARDVTRTLNPLRDVRLSFWIEYPLIHPQFAGYQMRLDEGVRDALPTIVQKGPSGVWIIGRDSPHGLSFAAGSMDEGVTDVSISRDSTFYPHPQSERMAYDLLRHFRLELAVFKTPIDVSNYRRTSEEMLETKSDLRLIAVVDAARLDEHALRLTYNLKSKRLTVRGSEIVADPRFWQSSGQIVSMNDLVGSQMLVRLSNFGDDAFLWSPEFSPIVSTFLLHIGDRKPLWFRSSRMRLATRIYGSPIYEYTFSQSFEEMLRKATCCDP